MKDISKETQRHKRDDTEDLTQLMCTDNCKSYQDKVLNDVVNSVSVMVKFWSFTVNHM